MDTHGIGRLARHGRLRADGAHAAEGDFDLIEPVFFSHQQCRRRGAGDGARTRRTLHDAFDIEALKRCDIIITAQGGDYTSDVYPQLRAAGWKGYWIDAASRRCA